MRAWHCPSLRSCVREREAFWLVGLLIVRASCSSEFTCNPACSGRLRAAQDARAAQGLHAAGQARGAPGGDSGGLRHQIHRAAQPYLIGVAVSGDRPLCIRAEMPRRGDCEAPVCSEVVTRVCRRQQAQAFQPQAWHHVSRCRLSLAGMANSCKHALSERTTWSSRLHDQAHAAFRSAPAHAPECARLGSCALPAISLQPGWDPDAQLRLARHGRAPGSPAGSRGCWTPPPARPGRSHWHGSCAVLHGRPPCVLEQTATHSLGMYGGPKMRRGALERNACGIAAPAAR